MNRSLVVTRVSGSDAASESAAASAQGGVRVA